MRRRSARRGASAIEFALTLPLVLAVVSAVLDYGWYLTQAANVLAAVREGARYGVTVDQDDGPETAAVNQTEAALAALGVQCGGAAGDCTVDASVGQTGTLDSLTVSVEVGYIPLMGLVPTPEHLRGALTMALEDQTGGS